MKTIKNISLYFTALLSIPVSYLFFDKPLYYVLLNNQGPKMVFFWKKMSNFGDTQSVYISLMAIGVVFFICRYIFKLSIKPALILLILYSYFTTTFMVQIIKSLSLRYRPDALPHGLYGFSSNRHTQYAMDSFPSLHTASICSLLIPIILNYPKTKYIIGFFLLLVSVSRLTLEVHFLSDVIAGGLLATIISKVLFYQMKIDLKCEIQKQA